MPVRHHAANIEILNDHSAGLAGQPGRELVQPILPDIADARMELRDLGARTRAVLPAFCLSRMGPLEPGEPLQISAQRFRTGKLAAIAQGCQVGNTEIDPENLLVGTRRKAVCNARISASSACISSIRWRPTRSQRLCPLVR